MFGGSRVGVWGSFPFFPSGKQTTLPFYLWRGKVLWERGWGERGLLLLRSPGRIRDLSLWDGVQRQTQRVAVHELINK